MVPRTLRQRVVASYCTHCSSCATTLNGNTHREMHPFFLATGPSFKRGATFEAFPNVDIYPLLCELLGIEPSPNNGSLANVAEMLAQPDPSGSNESNSSSDSTSSDGASSTDTDSKSNGGGIGAGFVGFLVGIVAACLVAIVMFKTGRVRFSGSQKYVAVSGASDGTGDLQFSEL